MTRGDAIRKARACFRLAMSPEPAEAAAALRQAQRLMRRHGLSEADLRIDRHTGRPYPRGITNETSQTAPQDRPG